MKIAAVIVAAGRGIRAGGGAPKQWRPLAGKTSVQYAKQTFAEHPDIGQLVIVLHPDDMAEHGGIASKGVDVVVGGETRRLSVLAGLEFLEGTCDQVLIHDAARPCVTHSVIDGVIVALRSHKAAAPAIAVVDALWNGHDGAVTSTVDRTNLYRAQTPQGFDLDTILAAHRASAQDAADDVELVRQAGIKVAITAGSEDNFKITVPDDFDRAARILRARNGH